MSDSIVSFDALSDALNEAHVGKQGGERIWGAMLPPDFSCPICYEPNKLLSIVCASGHHFCESCAELIYQDAVKRECSVCRQDLLPNRIPLHAVNSYLMDRGVQRIVPAVRSVTPPPAPPRPAPGAPRREPRTSILSWSWTSSEDTFFEWPEQESAAREAWAFQSTATLLARARMLQRAELAQLDMEDNPNPEQLDPRNCVD